MEVLMVMGEGCVDGGGVSGGCSEWVEVSVVMAGGCGGW